MDENRTRIVSLCCNKELEEKFLSVGKTKSISTLNLISGFSPHAEIVLADKSGMENITSLPEGTLLFLLEGERGQTSFSSDWINRAEYVFLPPFGHEAILRHITLLLGEKIEEPSQEHLKNQIAECLCTLQIPPRLLGHTYLLEGVLYLFSQPHPRSSRLLQKIYRQIADTHDTSPVMVDRAIRHGIETCWKKAPHPQLKFLLGYDPHDLLGMPTNGEFLYALYEHIRSLLTPSHGKLAFLHQLHLLSTRNEFILPK